MVTFICSACGQTVRKVQVEKHYQNECRNCDVLSCIDCGKDFHGDEYVAHTSCITEAEKYQGKLYKPKDKQNKGEHKQQEWLKQVREATKSGAVDPRLTALLDRISEYSNVPRKKGKFQNFCQNSIKVRDTATLDKLWEIFSASAKQSPQQDDTNSNGTHENGKSNLASVHEDKLDDEDECLEKTRKRQKDEEPTQKSKEKENKKTRDSKKHKKGKKLKDDELQETELKSKGNKNDVNGSPEEVDGLKKNKKQKKKRRREDEEEIDESCTQAKVLKVEIEENKEQQCNFKWKSVIKAALRQAPDQELPIKRLRKKVLAEFQAQGANVKDLTDNELRALFVKKVTNNPIFKVHKDRVKLVK